MTGNALWQDAIAAQQSFCDALPDPSPDSVDIGDGHKLVRVDGVKPGYNSMYVMEEGDIVSKAIINMKVSTVGGSQQQETSSALKLFRGYCHHGVFSITYIQIDKVISSNWFFNCVFSQTWEQHEVQAVLDKLFEHEAVSVVCKMFSLILCIIALSIPI